MQSTPICLTWRTRSDPGFKDAMDPEFGRSLAVGGSRYTSPRQTGPVWGWLVENMSFRPPKNQTSPTINLMVLGHSCSNLKDKVYLQIGSSNCHLI